MKGAEPVVDLLLASEERGLFLWAEKGELIAGTVVDGERIPDPDFPRAPLDPLYEVGGIFIVRP